MSDVQEVEVSIEAAKTTIAEAEAMTEFVKSPLYKKLIDDGYFKDYAARLVLLKADPSMSRPEQQAGILKSIDGIGEFRQYIGSILQMGNIARESLKAAESTYEEVLVEEAEGEAI